MRLCSSLKKCQIVRVKLVMFSWFFFLLVNTSTQNNRISNKTFLNLLQMLFLYHFSNQFIFAIIMKHIITQFCGNSSSNRFLYIEALFLINNCDINGFGFCYVNQICSIFALTRGLATCKVTNTLNWWHLL